MKFQINMAMHDVSNMAHVDRFSHIVMPMLWFEIAMLGLPQDLQNRFIFYLNILPWIVNICLYGSYVAGVLLLTWATIKASHQLKESLERAHNMQHVISVVSAGQIYVPCGARIVNDSEIQMILEHDEEDETDHILKVKRNSYYVFRHIVHFFYHFYRESHPKARHNLTKVVAG